MVTDRRPDAPRPRLQLGAAIASRRVYRAPILGVLGTLASMTAAKGGSSSDGGGKPRTRAWGNRA
jgi:hypothetical protein